MSMHRIRWVGRLAALALAGSALAAPAALAAPPRCFGEPATMVGTNGDDELHGTSGRDVIVARGGDDAVTSGRGADLICLGGGFDSARAGPGNDRVAGGPGPRDDIEGGRGDDYIDGGPGFIDHALYERSANPIHADLRRGEATGQGRDTLVRIEAVHGGPADDVLLGDDGPNDLDGRGGNNTIRGYGGDDFFLGALGGDDLVRGGPGSDFIDTGRGDDTIIAGAGDDFMIPGLDDDAISGAGGFDVVDHFFSVFDPVTGSASPAVMVDVPAGTITGNGHDTISGIEAFGGTDEDDTFIGSAASEDFHGFGGNDSMTGGLGNDFLLPGLGDDVVDGGGNDPIDVALGSPGAGDLVIFDFVSPIAPTPRGVRVDLLAGTAVGHGADTLAGIESAVTTFDFDDTIRGSNGRNALVGLGGSDLIAGRDGDDLLDGDHHDGGSPDLPGTDELNGGAGANDICLGGEVTENCEHLTPAAAAGAAIAAALGGLERRLDAVSRYASLRAH